MVESFEVGLHDDGLAEGPAMLESPRDLAGVVRAHVDENYESELCIESSFPDSMSSPAAFSQREARVLSSPGIGFGSRTSCPDGDIAGKVSGFSSRPRESSQESPTPKAKCKMVRPRVAKQVQASQNSSGLSVEEVVGATRSAQSAASVASIPNVMTSAAAVITAGSVSLPSPAEQVDQVHVSLVSELSIEPVIVVAGQREEQRESDGAKGADRGDSCGKRGMGREGVGVGGGESEGGASTCVSLGRPRGSSHKAHVFSRVDVFDEALRKRGGTEGLFGGKANPQDCAPQTFTPGAQASSSASAFTGLHNLRVLRAPSKECPPSKAHPSLGRPLLECSPDSRKGTTEEETHSGVDRDTSPAGRLSGVEGDGDMAKEWDEVANRTDEIRARHMENAGILKVQSDAMSTPIVYREVETWMSTLDVVPSVLQEVNNRVVEDVSCGCVPRLRRVGDVPGLEHKFSKDKDVLLYLKFLNFDFNELVHFRMLRTMYTKLTRNKVCSSIGSHWQTIGFQSGDPRTDLNRSCCVLNVVHMFYFFTHYFDIMKAAYLLAQDYEQNFPLACVSINITGMVMERLLAGSLSSLCNRSSSLINMVCEVYCGGIHYFYKQWRNQKRTIRDTEKTFKEVRALMERPKVLLNELAAGVQERRSKTDASRLEFTDMSFGTSRVSPPARVTMQVPERLRNYNAGAADG